MVSDASGGGQKGGLTSFRGRFNNASDASFMLLIRSESVAIERRGHFDLRYSRSSRTNWLHRFNGNLIDQPFEPH